MIRPILELETKSHTETVDVDISADPASDSVTLEIDLEATVAEQQGFAVG